MAAAPSSSETSARPQPAPLCGLLRPRPRSAVEAEAPSRPRPPLRPPAGLTSVAARFQGSAEVTARAELTRLLSPLPRPPSPSLPASLPASPHGGGRDSSSTQDGESSATAAGPARASRPLRLRGERTGPAEPLPREKSGAPTPTGTQRCQAEGKLKGKYGFFSEGKGRLRFPQLRRND